MRFVSLLFVSTIFLGCSPYGDPDLGDNPFRCGTGEPACPDGYQCTTVGTDQICQANGGGGGGEFVCADDSAIEPNESPIQAFPTGIPSEGVVKNYSNVAICPESDIDVFSFAITGVNQVATASVTYNRAQGDLALELIDSGETLLRAGTHSTSDPNLLEATSQANLAQGTYFWRVYAAGGQQNNYSIQMRLQ